MLSREEEVLLGRHVYTGTLAAEILLDTNAFQRIPAHSIPNLLNLIEKAAVARDALIRRNTRLVISVAKKYRDRGVPFLDLIQEGNLGLITAVRKFDPERGNKFSTFAIWWIRQSVTRALADQSRTIRIPVHASDELGIFGRKVDLLTQRLGQIPTPEEISESLSISRREVVNYLRILRIQPASLDAPMSDEADSVTMSDLIPDHSAPHPEISFDAKTTILEVEAAIEALKCLPRDKQIIRLYLGLTDGGNRTLEETGAAFGLTRERARQIIERELPHLRNLLSHFRPQTT